MVEASIAMNVVLTFLAKIEAFSAFRSAEVREISITGRSPLVVSPPVSLWKSTGSVVLLSPWIMIPVGSREEALTGSLKERLKTPSFMSRLKLRSSGSTISSPNVLTIKPGGIFGTDSTGLPTISTTKSEVNVM